MIELLLESFSSFNIALHSSHPQGLNMVLMFQGEPQNSRANLMNSFDDIAAPIEREMLMLFSVLEQCLEKIKTNTSPLRALIVVENLRQIVQENVAFADRICAEEMGREENRCLLELLSQFFSGLGPLQKSLNRGIWHSMLGLDPSRSRMKSSWIRDGFQLALRQTAQLVEAFFQLYSEKFAVVRPDRQWLEIAASYWVELSRLCEQIAKSV